MISHFFIDRPLFATVLSVVITLAGGLAVFSLPTAQYPPISPPQVQVAINYPGASAQVVADTVAAPIEQQVNGVPGMLYMTSLSGNTGTYTLFVTFELGTDLNTARVMVQKRVQLAVPLLPTSVQNQGITIRKKTPDILMVINLYSPDDRYDQLYLSNFAQINLYDPLLRVDGVSDISILGSLPYSMRAWLDPQKLASRSMNAVDVANAVSSQNVQAAPGRIGQPPSGWRGAFDLPIDTLGRLTEPDQFGDIVVKVSNPGPMSRGQGKTTLFAGAKAAAGLPGASVTNPLQAARPSGSPVGLPGLGVAPSNGTTTTGTTTIGVTGSTMGDGALSGGASTGGGATSPGGGTTSGGGAASGGATTSGAASGATASAGMANSAMPTGMGIPGLSINTGPGATGTTDAMSGGGLVAGPLPP